MVSRRFGLGISACHKLVLEVCTAIKTVLMPKYLIWPDIAGLRNIKGEFENISGISNVVGSILTLHVPIIAPKTSVSAYFNKRHIERTRQRSCYSVTIQGVVDHIGVFTNVCIGWPGSLRDNESTLHDMAQRVSQFMLRDLLYHVKYLAITVALSVVLQKFLRDSNQHSLLSTSVIDCHIDIRSRTLTCEILNNHDLAKCFKTPIVG
ncbi:hypothetical protein Fmac_014976 [Flemingia macrophylla]|uniref:DDE Tnp4 domain-containing protein n=1 Tax=Flemingia macrophylla TaxID=520843 RepID=A0ABD1MD96_9FABA